MASTTAVGEAEVLTSIIAAIPAQPATCYYKHIHAIADVFFKKKTVLRGRRTMVTIMYCQLIQLSQTWYPKPLLYHLTSASLRLGFEKKK
jgi:hypothetical protein